MFRQFCFFCRLREAGLLTLSRLVEVGPIQLDRSLMTALVNRWRPETHTFHLPCGEMTPTLQDVAYLLGLPILGLLMFVCNEIAVDRLFIHFNVRL